MWLHIKQTINTKTHDKQNLVVIGDSRSKAGFIPNEINEIKSLNLSIGGAAPMEGYYTLLKYLNNNPAPENIILSYSAYHLINYSLYWDRTVPYDFLLDEDYKDIEVVASQYHFLKANKSYIDYKNPMVYRVNFNNGITGMRWKKNSQVLKECIASQGHHYFGTRPFSKRLNADTKKSRFKASAFQDYYFRKMLALAKEFHIKLYFFIIPFNKASFEKVNKTYIDHYHQYIKNLSETYNMKMCNQLTFMENSNFGDSSHLFKGAKVNTKNMFDCIN